MTRRLRRQLVAITVLVAATAPLAACGGPDARERAAARIVRQALRGGDAGIEDGYLSLSVRLVPGGSPAGEPVTFTLFGPFSATPAGGFPRFAVEIATTAADMTSVADVRCSGTLIRVMPREGPHRVADALAARLRRSSHARDTGGLPVLGFDASRWIRNPERRRNERVAGVATVRLGGSVDIARLLGDVAGLLADAGDVPSAATLRSPRLRSATADAADWDIIDIWTGASDGLLRQLAARVDFTFSRRSTLPGAAPRATLEVHVRVDHVNERR